MALDTNFNINPYYDDFDPAKNYLRLLFKPGYAVQARELTQIQSLLQNQVEKFGNHIFKNGSVVTGGQFFIQNSTYLKLNTSYLGVDINSSNFVGKTILSNDATKRAEVIKVYDADAGTGDPITLMVKQIYGADFVAGEIIKTSEATPVFATIATSGVGTGQTFSVNEGVFYYEGFFVSNDAQTIATSKYNNTTATARIGFEISEAIVNNNNDTSLLDPAQNASNFQAPGSDRYRITLTLATRTLESVDDSQFIELARVENGQITRENKYPIYAVIEDTLARRTYDESGNYTVKTFNISLQTNSANSAQTDVIMSPGKAYVYGYEFETNSPTTITIDKPRTTSSVSNKRVPADFGNFIYTTNHFGSFAINNFDTIDLHCVDLSSINTTTTSTIANTKIGTARVKTISFDTASNTSNSGTYQYKTFLFDVDVGSLTGGVANANSSNITIGSQFSSSNVAYVGAQLRIVSGLGSDDTTKIITGYNGVTKTLDVSPSFAITPSNTSVFSIDFEFNDVESLAKYSSNSILSGASVSSRSEDAATPFNDVILSDSSLEPLIFKLGEDYISQNTIADLSFSYKRLYQAQSFGSSISPALSTGTGEDIASGSTSTSRLQNYYITVSTQGTSPYANGSVIPADKFTVDNSTNRITVDSGNNMVANIIATIDVSTISQKAKTYVTANATIQTSSGVDVFSNTAVISYPTQGQLHIANTFISKTTDVSQSLFVSDVTAITQILDFQGNLVTSANAAIAANVTSSYIFDNGQRDSFYDHSSITLKPKTVAPTGPIVVFYNRFTSSGAGYFTVDSYSGVAYENIPVYSSTKNNTQYNLTDSLDFRPVRSDATVGTGSSVSFNVDPSTTGPKIPDYGSDIVLDYAYYLPRIDKVVIDKTKKFQIVKGNPSLDPIAPNDTTTGMTLYVLSYSPYVTTTDNIDIKQISQRRYTMRDIGQIEKRVENLEYYTSLSLLEQEAIAKQDLTILDTQNLPRFKNGIVVDSFKGHSVADVTNLDYAAAIDPLYKELRPSFNISAHRLKFDSANSTNFSQKGSLVTANSSPIAIIDQPKASKFLNVNPFNVINYLGKIKLSPQSDIWVDTVEQPKVLVNIGGDRDAWALLAQNTFSLEWNSWNSVWLGHTRDTSEAWVGRSLIETTTTTVNESQTRTGISTRVVPQTLTQSIGDRIVDVSIVPFMRDINVLVVGTDFKPSTRLYSFFDDVNVDQYVGNRVNRIYLANNNIGFNVDLSNPEVLSIRNKTANTSNAQALVVHVSNNIVYVTNITPNTSIGDIANCEVLGAQTGLRYDVSSYEHNGGAARLATSNTITLALDAVQSDNQSSYVGSTILITQGTGAGQSRTISAYNVTTGIATVSSNWTTLPAANVSFYGIGNLTTDASGSTVGLFSIPNSVFRVGEKLFRLNDNPFGDIPSSSTNGDGTFFAQGLIQSTEETIVSTIAPTIQRQSLSDARIVTDVTRSTRVLATIAWIDPLAETFLISPDQYPEGLFLSKIRFCFKSKDASVPITLQLRPTVNGYPSSSVVYPFSTVSLTPDKVKVTASPDINDSTKYTEFVFDSPVYMQPGEHSFVLLANSNKYEVYVAEIGKLDLVSGRQISEQPYGGTLFLSQNGSTWTADQNSDLMFRLFRQDFVTNSVTAQFLIDTPITNVEYNTLEIITSDVTLANTALAYQYNSEIATGGFAGFSPITPFSSYELTDSDGTRILNTTTGNTSFVLRGTLQSNSSKVSPIVDISRLGIITVGNRINNLGLSNVGITLANTGSGYANAADVTVTISGGNGSGASAVANVVSNTINAIYITAAGSGYTESPTITITAGSGGGANASVTYNGETDKSGGNATARYITRRVTLADGFDSGDLRVYLTANKPTGTNVHVYYKLISASDPDLFDDKRWRLMTEIGNPNFVSLNSTEFRELVFAPGDDGIPSNSVSYTSGSTAYSSFRTFAIKIVMTSQTPAIVPRLRDLRAIALPAA